MHVPRTWRDRSALAFESPRRQLATDPRRPNNTREYTNNVHVSFEDRASHLESPGDYLTIIADQLTKKGVVSREVRRFDLPDSDVSRMGVERRVNTAGGWVRQLSVVSFYEDVVVVATAATLEPCPEATLNELHDLLASVRLD
ncbi:MAG: hypothetical protein AAFP04_06680 [Myxococcota bacterium]